MDGKIYFIYIYKAFHKLYAFSFLYDWLSLYRHTPGPSVAKWLVCKSNIHKFQRTVAFDALKPKTETINHLSV